MHNPPVYSYKFREKFGARVLSELAEHTESKMIPFYE